MNNWKEWKCIAMKDKRMQFHKVHTNFPYFVIKWRWKRNWEKRRQWRQWWQHEFPTDKNGTQGFWTMENKSKKIAANVMHKRTTNVNVKMLIFSLRQMKYYICVHFYFHIVIVFLFEKRIKKKMVFYNRKIQQKIFVAANEKSSWSVE